MHGLDVSDLWTYLMALHGGNMHRVKRSGRDWGGWRVGPASVSVWAAMFFLVAVFFFSSSSCAAATAKGRILRVEGDYLFPPYEFIDGANQASGWNAELFHAVAEAAGLKYELELVPWNHAREDIEAGRVDVLLGMLVSSDRRQRVDFSSPHLSMYHTIFVRKGSSISSLEDLRGCEVIVQNGDIMHDFVTHQKLGQDRLMAVETPAEGLQLLAAGRGDAMLMGKFQGLYLIRTLGLEGVVPVGPSLEGRQYAFAVKKGDEALVAALNEGLRIVKESGQYDALHEKWFGVTSDRWSRNEIGLVLGWIVAPACVSLVLVLAWNQGLRRLVAKKTASLEQELAARVRAEGQLQELAAQLRNTVHVRTAEYDAASSELEGFCYSVAHDLRAPLRAINGYATMLQEECKQPSYPPCRQYLERIRHSAKSLGTLIDSLLSLSQLTRSPMRRETVDISAIARGLAAELQSREPSRRAEIHVQPEMTVVGDAHLLEEAMRQLLGNAWKFSSKKEQTEIRVACEVVDGERVFSVSDRGAGFDMAHATNLFRPFYRLHAVGEFEGSAIGLATVDRSVRRHGGRVWAQGEPDSGATFYFALRDAGEPATSTCRLGDTSAGGEVSSQ